MTETAKTIPVMHSMIDMGGNRATVTFGGEPVAHVFRAEGFWNVKSALTGELLLPREPHTLQINDQRTGATRRDVPMGVILDKLRRKLVRLHVERG
jgi:hypothetical protein